MNTSAPRDALPTHSALPSRRTAALCGVLSAMVGLGFAELVAGFSRGLQSPILDAGNRVVDNVPPAIKDIAISLFGTNDKIALLVGIGITLLAYAAAVGVVALRRNFRWGVAGVALFGIAGSWSALADQSSSWSAPVPAIAGSMVVVGALWLFGVVLGVVGADKDQGVAATITELIPSDRRRFFATAGAVSVGAATFALIGRQLNARFSAATSRAEVELPPAIDPLSAEPAGVQAKNAATFFTPNEDFYRIDTALSVPQVPVDTWNLRVHGLVDSELNLSFEDLLDREVVEKDITLTCVSNTVGGFLTGNARWLGVRLDDLLDEAGIDSSADQIVGRSVDGYTCGFPTAALDGRDALVAFGMNGEPLPLEHGFPARLIVPGLYGYVSATKWLTEIELTTFDAFDHYWVPRGYSVEAPIKMQSRIDTPRGLDKIPAGDFVIGGVAWNQTVGIDGVEIQVDDGEWTPAELADELTEDTWRQWSLPWNFDKGRHSVAVRAISRDGAIQTADRSEPLPDGASGHHKIVVIVE